MLTDPERGFEDVHEHAMINYCWRDLMVDVTLRKIIQVHVQNMGFEAKETWVHIWPHPSLALWP